MKSLLNLLIISFISINTIASGDNYHIGARQAAMGNTGVALSDVWSNHHNQAGLAYVDKLSFGVSGESMFLLTGVSTKAGVVAIPTKSGTFGLNITSFGYSAYNETKIGLAFAKPFGEKLAIGVQLDYITVGLGENYGRASAFSIEAGILAKPNEKLSIGAHIFNPNRAKITAYNEERIPTVMRIGVDYVFSAKVLVDAEIEKDIDNKAVFKTGVEYHISDPLYLRIGIASNPFLSAFGFGINLKNFNIDIATSYHSVLGYTPQVSLTYNM